MTTTCGIIYNDGVVMAADSRATMGHFIASRTAKKLHMISSTVGFSIAGGVGDALELIRVLKSEAAIYQFRRGYPMRVAAVNSLLSNFMTQNRGYPYEVHPTIGGYDDTGARLFTMDAVGGSSEEVAFCSTGSGSPAALGILEDDYVAGMVETEAVDMAKRCITTAKKRDAGSGDAIAVVIIDKEGYRECHI